MARRRAPRGGNLRRTLAQRRGRGFTLIELLLVLVILAVLATVVATRFTGTSQKAHIRAAQASIDALKTGLKMFETNCGRFPTTDEGLQALLQAPADLPDWNGRYIDQQTIPEDPWHHPFQYRCPSEHNMDFDLWSYGPDGQDGTDDDITNWGPPPAK